jgi:hypothetical protein
VTGNEEDGENDNADDYVGKTSKKRTADLS